jgi:hypothetical protein
MMPYGGVQAGRRACRQNTVQEAPALHGGLHDVREKLGLSLNTYVVIDSIHKLSTSDPKFPYCVMSKPNMAEFLQLGERTVYRSLNEAQELGLIERGEHGLRATEKWIRMVEIYDIRS